MSHQYLMVAIVVFITTEATSGEEVKKAVGDQVSFKLDNIGSPVTSITWKHVTPGSTVKAIEWEDGEGITIPNPRFKDITTLNIVTGQINITNLRFEHSGDYTIDVSGKEQTQKRFTLTVMNRVPKPVIEMEEVNAEVVYLSCKNYDGTITWSNSAGEDLAYQSNKESITVQKNQGNPENSYTCKLKNAVSEETSDPVHKKNLFQAESTGGPWWIAVIVIPIILVIGSVPLYKFNDKFKNFVGSIFPCLKADQGRNKGESTENTVDEHLKLNSTEGKEPPNEMA
ncbi:uncharacterized protein si:ch211-132g1.3 isoform X3 [Pimephales promelas]|uniref:uncharacterized protein si:ch211-132g1.3 isoform X3 n=1 Tax=Pimephales promelas TaxID=90988 RepID=UPI0019556CFC|nr:uncharacterized protein si:ch211-132g1.3 isoform X3 [Pimephales promelas]